MRFTAQMRYDAEPAAVAAMLLDDAFRGRTAAATGALRHEVGVERFDDGSATVTVRRTMPTERVPDFVRGFVGQTLEVTQIDDWGPAAADGSREGTIVVEIKGAPVRLAGSMQLRAEGGATVETVDADLKASVPLVGGKIEKAVEPALTAAIDVEQREGRAWLTKG